MPDICECVTCCNGEHAGFCRECAGWRDRIDDSEEGFSMCEYCDGEGICPKCQGANIPPENDDDADLEVERAENEGMV
jgi:hypothetical protein